jgi:hypothetical protein
MKLGSSVKCYLTFASKNKPNFNKMSSENTDSLKVKIGLEIHARILSKSKIFSKLNYSILISFSSSFKVNCIISLHNIHYQLILIEIIFLNWKKSHYCDVTSKPVKIRFSTKKITLKTTFITLPFDVKGILYTIWIWL